MTVRDCWLDEIILEFLSTEHSNSKSYLEKQFSLVITFRRFSHFTFPDYLSLVSITVGLSAENSFKNQRFSSKFGIDADRARMTLFYHDLIFLIYNLDQFAP